MEVMVLNSNNAVKTKVDKRVVNGDRDGHWCILVGQGTEGMNKGETRWRDVGMGWCSKGKAGAVG